MAHLATTVTVGWFGFIGCLVTLVEMKALGNDGTFRLVMRIVAMSLIDLDDGGSGLRVCPGESKSVLQQN